MLNVIRYQLEAVFELFETFRAFAFVFLTTLGKIFFQSAQFFFFDEEFTAFFFVHFENLDIWIYSIQFFP